MSRVFNGTSGNVNPGDIGQNSVRSYSVWIYVVSGGEGGGLGRIFDKLNSGSTAKGETLRMQGNAQIRYSRGWSGAAADWQVLGLTLANGWHHVLVVYDGTSSSNVPTIYVDGVSQTVNTITGASGTIDTANTDNFYIGNRGADDRTFDGRIAELAIWNSINLGSADAVMLARGGNPLHIAKVRTSLTYYAPLYGASTEPDYSGNHKAGTVTTATVGAHAPVGAFTRATPWRSGNFTRTASLSGAVTPSATIVKQMQTTKSGSCAPSGSILKSVSKSFSGVLTPTGTLIKSVGKSLSGAITPAGATVKSIAKALGGAVAPAGAVLKSVAKSFAGTITAAGAATIQALTGGVFTPDIVITTALHRTARIASSALNRTVRIPATLTRRIGFILDISNDE